MSKLRFFLCVTLIWIGGMGTAVTLLQFYPILSPPAPTCPAPLTYKWEEPFQPSRALTPAEVKL